MKTYLNGEEIKLGDYAWESWDDLRKGHKELVQVICLDPFEIVYTDGSTMDETEFAFILVKKATIEEIVLHKLES